MSYGLHVRLAHQCSWFTSWQLFCQKSWVTRHCRVPLYLLTKCLGFKDPRSILSSGIEKVGWSNIAHPSLGWTVSSPNCSIAYLPNSTIRIILFSVNNYVTRKINEILISQEKFNFSPYTYKKNLILVSIVFDQKN